MRGVCSDNNFFFFLTFPSLLQNYGRIFWGIFGNCECLNGVARSTSVTFQMFCRFKKINEMK